MNKWENRNDAMPGDDFDDELFWVSCGGVVKMARLNRYPVFSCFQDLNSNDEGMCGFYVDSWMHITQNLIHRGLHDTEICKDKENASKEA